jgi:hypothetical protein
VRDHRHRGQYQQLDRTEQDVPGQLEAAAEQAHGGLIEHQRHPGQGHSGREQAGLPERPADVAEPPAEVRRQDDEAESEHERAAERGEQRGGDQAGAGGAPGQLADEHRAEAQHPDRTEQGHG